VPKLHQVLPRPDAICYKSCVTAPSRTIRIDADLYDYLTWRSEQNGVPLGTELRSILLAIVRVDSTYLAASGRSFGASPVSVDAAMAASIRTGRPGRPPGNTLTEVKGWVGVYMIGTSYRARNGSRTITTCATVEEAARAYDDEIRKLGLNEVNFPQPGELLHPRRVDCYCPITRLNAQRRHDDGCPGVGKTWWDERWKTQAEAGR